MRKYFLLLGLLLIGTLSSNSSESWARGGSIRAKKKFGVTYTSFGGPFPADYGLSLNYNIAPWIRLNGAYGLSFTDPVLSTFGGGAEFLIPSWAFSPVLGVAWSTTSGSPGQQVSVQSFTETFNYTQGESFLALEGGLDWTFPSGISAGAGYLMNLFSLSASNLYFRFGYYF